MENWIKEALNLDSNKNHLIIPFAMLMFDGIVFWVFMKYSVWLRAWNAIKSPKFIIPFNIVWCWQSIIVMAYGDDGGLKVILPTQYIYIVVFVIMKVI